MSNAAKDLLSFAEALKDIAFKIPAPNEWTPQLVQLAQAAESCARMRQAQEQRQLRKLIRNLKEDHEEIFGKRPE